MKIGDLVAMIISLKRYLISVSILFLVFGTHYVFAAKADDLLGRWQLIGDASSEFSYLQFESEGRLYIEEKQGSDSKAWAAKYTVDDTGLLIPFLFDSDALQFSVEKKQLILTHGDEILTLEPEPDLKFYSNIARDSEMHIMQIKAVDINVEIFGERAITHVMYTIKNNHDEDLEAKVEIPLPEDALVVGYALDIGDSMINGVAVPKGKARQAFEELEDEQVDPGIAEMTRGNNFSTEIYPVPSKGTRKVRVSYTHSLDRNLIGAYSYDFPLSQIDSNAAITVTMSADGMRFIPLVKKSPFENPAWEEANTGSRFYFADALSNSFSRAEQLKDLEVRFTPLKDSSGVIARALDGHRYLFAKLDINEELLSAIETPTRISVLWDASSSASQNHKDKLKVLAGFLKNIKKLKLEKIELQLVVFANEIIHSKIYQIGGVEDPLVLAELINLRYDGATRFDLAAQETKSFIPDYALLFSDGVSSLGSLSPIKIGKPLYVISASDKTDLPWLYKSAYENKGLLLNLARLGIAKTTEYIGKQIPPLDLRVNGETYDAEISTWLRIDSTINLSVAAQLPKELEDMQDGTLAFSMKDTLLHVASFEQKAVGEFARYDWLRLKLNNLSGDLVNNEEEITSLGMQYSLATPYTSLMVLEELEDYVSYGIRPPSGFPGAKRYDELRASYLAAEGDEKITQQNILEFLVDEWETRTEWWMQSKHKTSEDVAKELEEQKHKKKESSDDGVPLNSPSPGGEVEEIQISGMRASLQTSEDVANGDGSTVTTVQPWSPDVPYLQRIKVGDPKGKKSNLDLYFEEKLKFSESPTFYMDVAQYFFESGDAKVAERIISNVLETNPENVALERMVAYNLEQFKAYDAAIAVLEHVKQLNFWEASSARDLARVWEKKALASNEARDYQQAIDYYVEAITGPWEVEEELRIVALMEFNHLLAKLKTKEMNIPEWKASLLKNLDVDVRVVLGWNSRVADIDIWVKEPSGEFVSYRNRNGIGGGYLPFDVTDGFGPEEYLTRFALEGGYEIFVDLFSNRSVELFGPISLTLDIYTNYGRENEEVHTTTVRLVDEGERIPVGNIDWH